MSHINAAEEELKETNREREGAELLRVNSPSSPTPFCAASVFQEMLCLRQDISVRATARWGGDGKRRELAGQREGTGLQLIFSLIA